MALLRAREAVMARFRPMLKQHGITEQQWRVVRVLAEAEEIEVSQLANRTSILGPSLSRILQTLEQVGLITRRQDANDGRVFWLSLNSPGRALIDKVQPDAVKIYAEIEVAIGAPVIDRLLADLDHVIEALKPISGAVGAGDEDA